MYLFLQVMPRLLLLNNLLVTLSVCLNVSQWEATCLHCCLWLVRATESKQTQIDWAARLNKAGGASSVVYIYVNLHLTIWTCSQGVCVCVCMSRCLYTQVSRCTVCLFPGVSRYGCVCDICACAWTEDTETYNELSWVSSCRGENRSDITWPKIPPDPPPPRRWKASKQWGRKLSVPTLKTLLRCLSFCPSVSKRPEPGVSAVWVSGGPGFQWRVGLDRGWWLLW